MTPCFFCQRLKEKLQDRINSLSCLKIEEQNKLQPLFYLTTIAICRLEWISSSVNGEIENREKRKSREWRGEAGCKSHSKGKNQI